jgi:hypothetical protein
MSDAGLKQIEGGLHHHVHCEARFRSAMGNSKSGLMKDDVDIAQERGHQFAVSDVARYKPYSAVIQRLA